MKHITEEERDRIFELSKTQWIQCKDYMPEEILPWIEHENYHMPEKYCDYDEVNKRTVYHTKPTQDLHYLTPKVLLRTYNSHAIDFRRKFDSMKTFIWQDFEGCYGDYDWFWMQLPELTDKQLQQMKIDEDICWNTPDGQETAHKKFYKTIEIDSDYETINNSSNSKK